MSTPVFIQWRVTATTKVIKLQQKLAHNCKREMKFAKKWNADNMKCETF